MSDFSMPTASQAASVEASADASAKRRAVPLSAFLDQVAGVLRGGLPERLWIEATVVEARASASGHTLELADPTAGKAATLRVFLAASALVSIRRELGLLVDPLLLVEMTTCLLVAPNFGPRWHLGGRVEALSRDTAASLRTRQLQRTVAALKHERLWDRQHRLPRPRDVTRLAVIHPAAAAGWGDIAGELGRWQGAGLLSVRSHPAPFEGERAAAAIVAATRAAIEPIEGHCPDLVLIVRGGGARASLAVLDEESVARAILDCPAPVVCGTGHAQDRTLADHVAWRSADTPSKTLTLVADLIRGTAQAATCDWEAIRGAAATMLLTHAGQLDKRRQAVLAAITHALTAADRQLVALWSGIAAEMKVGEERIRALEGELDRQLTTILQQAPHLLDAADQKLQQLLQLGLTRAVGLLGRADHGAALLVSVQARASAVLEREAAALQRGRDEVEGSITRQLDREQAALERLLTMAEAADLNRVLARGFAIVTDEAGHLLSTRAAAEGHASLRLRFCDGALPVRPVVA